MILASRPFPATTSSVEAPFERDHLAPTAWFDPASSCPGGATLSLSEILAGMLGSSQAATPILQQIEAHPEGIWIDLELPVRDSGGAACRARIGAFHRLTPLPPNNQVLLAWYGQRLMDLESEAHLLRGDLDKARRILAQQEGALRQERARVETLLESSEEPASIQDTGYRIQAQNDAHRRLFGDRRGEECHRVYRELSEPCPGCPMPEALAGRTAAEASDRPDQGPLKGEPVRIRTLPLFAHDNSAAGVVEILSRAATAAVERDVGVPSTAVLLRELEQQHILEVLERSGGNRAQAARLLGISRATLWRRLGARDRRATPSVESA
jgi:PAS domain-containing protein